MPIDIKDFQEEVDYKFWKRRTQMFPFPDPENFKDLNREDFLNTLGRKLHFYEHAFQKPEYLYLPKYQGILRKVKIYSLEDSCIYYYCVKKIEEEISEKIMENKNVYGGFQFSKRLRSLDREDDELIYDPKYGTGYNPINYRKEWKKYHKKARQLATENYDYYIQMDIAHFYDDINLAILEEEIRNSVEGKLEIINLLFHFLRFSDKRDRGYTSSYVGIPQEYLGDMSRLLANFYLIPFDTKIRSYLENHFRSDDQYEYMRWADDIWICYKGDQRHANHLVKQASLELGKLDLHLNEKKLRIRTGEEFDQYWKFSKWDAMLKNKDDMDFMLKMYNELYEEENRTGRWYSLARYILKIITSDKSNLEYFQDFKQDSDFFEKLLQYPLMIPKLKTKHKQFCSDLIRRHPKLKSYSQDYLSSQRNYCPLIEYFLLSRIANATSNDSEPVDVDFFTKYFFEGSGPESLAQEYKWYTRCICLDFFRAHSEFIENERKDELGNICEHLSAISNNQNQIERRYSIKFLFNLRRMRGKGILDGCYNRPEDLSLINYLNSKS